MKFVAIGCFCAGALAALGCADSRSGPTGPSGTGALSGFAAAAPAVPGNVSQPDSRSLSASPRSGELHVTKECSHYATDSFCTILTSNVKAIEPGTKVIYLQPTQTGTPAGSDVVLDPPGPGTNRAFGHCSVALGICTFAGGTGKFISFSANVDVTHTDDFSVWFWDGTFSFSPQD